MDLILPQAGAVTETLFGLFQVVFQLRGKKKQKTENTHIYSTQKSNVREQAALTKETPNSAQVSNGKQIFLVTSYDKSKQTIQNLVFI